MAAIAISPQVRTLHLTRRGRALRAAAVFAGVALVASPVVTRVGESFAGQLAPSSVVVSSPAVTVEVVAGDTLWGIARRMFPQEDPRRMIAEIRETNQLPSNMIHPGQLLLMPSN